MYGLQRHPSFTILIDPSIG